MDQTLTNRTSEHICAMLEDQNTSQRAEHSGNNKGDPVQMLFQLEWRASVLLGTWARCRGLMRDPLLVYAEWSQGRMEIIVEKEIEGEVGNRAFASSCFHTCSVAQSCPTLIACQAPLQMRFFSKNTGAGCHFLFQGIFPTHGSNSYLHLQIHLIINIRRREISIETVEIGTEDGEQSQHAWKEGWETEPQELPELQGMFTECLQLHCGWGGSHSGFNIFSSILDA